MGQKLARWLLVAFILCCLYAYFVEPRTLRLEQVTVKIGSLPAHLGGYTIGVFSDLHLDRAYLDSLTYALERLRDEQPDIYVLVGDITEDPRLVGILDSILLETLGDVRPYAVPGNWDRWYHDGLGAPPAQVELLVNRGVLVAPGLWLAGIDDALQGRPSIDKAVQSAPRDAIRILLAHEPDVADWVLPRHNISLQISGHSHGGQINVPILSSLFLPRLGTKYISGLAQTPTHQVYTSPGLGMSRIRMRFLCPPTVTIITLVADS